MAEMIIEKLFYYFQRCSKSLQNNIARVESPQRKHSFVCMSTAVVLLSEGFWEEFKLELILMSLRFQTSEQVGSHDERKSKADHNSESSSNGSCIVGFISLNSVQVQVLATTRRLLNRIDFASNFAIVSLRLTFCNVI